MTAVGALPQTKPADRIAFVWGLAEAVLFFVIPDVFLTLLAIRVGFRTSWRAALWATAGAVVGGLFVYVWATLDPVAVFSLMNLLPGIDAEMIEAVRHQTADSGTAALLGGPWQGIPYKLYAVASGELGLGALSLVLWTVPGRLVRFLIAIAAASYLRMFFGRWVSQPLMVTAWALFWLAVYLGYWFG